MTQCTSIYLNDPKRAMSIYLNDPKRAMSIDLNDPERVRMTQHNLVTGK